MKYKRVLSLLLCITIAIGCISWRPQKADAIAVTTTTATIAAVAAIMTACGVSYWANTQQDAISYLGGKIDDYLETLSTNTTSYEEWLGVYSPSSVFTVIGNGVLSFSQSVANKVLGFVRWYNQEENVVSNGQAVGEKGGAISGIQVFHRGSTLYGTESFSYSGNLISCNFNSRYGATTAIYIPASSIGTSNLLVTCITSNRSGSLQLEAGLVPGTAYSTGSLKSVSTNATWTYNYDSTKPYIYLGFHFNSTSQYACTGTVTFSIAGSSLSTPDKVLITPSSSVIVPQDVAVGQTLEVITNSNIVRGDTQEEACQAILDTVVSTTGLSSTSTTEGEAVPSAWIWLFDLVHGLPSTIAQSISELFAPSDAYVQSFVDDLNSTFSGHFSILSYPFSILGEFITRASSAGSQEPIFQWPNVYEPFSSKLLIAAGSYNLNRSLDNTTFANLYSIYLIVIKGYLSFSFLKFLYAWFCDVFKMRESDYDAPEFGGDSDDS